jgi:hypothetical protein
MFIVCIFRDHSITTDTCCALCVWNTPSNTLCIVMASLLGSVTIFDGNLYFEDEGVSGHILYSVFDVPFFLTRITL